MLVDVASRDIVNADSVTLRQADGLQRQFRLGPEVMTDPNHPNSASHLRLHMITGDPVVIEYRETQDGPLAVRIFDASGG